jgi:hypothetical protein
LAIDYHAPYLDQIFVISVAVEIPSILPFTQFGSEAMRWKFGSIGGNSDRDVRKPFKVAKTSSTVAD